jgi:hypothetical protein
LKKPAHGAKAMVTGPEAPWQGIASFGLLALLVASLGLTRLPHRAEANDPFAQSIRSCGPVDPFGKF